MKVKLAEALLRRKELNGTPSSHFTKSPHGQEYEHAPVKTAHQGKEIMK